jgi:hypothetical protein
MFFPDQSLYLGSKGAVEQFVRCLAWELGPRKITVNAVSPDVVMFLTSDDGRWVTGQNIGAGEGPGSTVIVPELSSPLPDGLTRRRVVSLAGRGASLPARPPYHLSGIGAKPLLGDCIDPPTTVSEVTPSGRYENRRSRKSAQRQNESKGDVDAVFRASKEAVEEPR